MHMHPCTRIWPRRHACGSTPEPVEQLPGLPLSLPERGHALGPQADLADLLPAAAAARQRQRHLQAQHAARLAAAEHARRARAEAAAAREAAAAAAAKEAEAAAAVEAAEVEAEAEAEASTAAAAAAKLAELEVAEQRRMALSGRLPPALVDDLALMAPEGPAGGGKGQQQKGEEGAKAATEVADTAEPAMPAAADADAEGLGKEAEQQEGLFGERRTAAAVAAAAGAELAAGAVREVRRPKLCDPSRCPLHSAEPTPMIRPTPRQPKAVSAPAAGAAGSNGASAAVQPPNGTAAASAGGPPGTAAAGKAPEVVAANGTAASPSAQPPSAAATAATSPTPSAPSTVATAASTAELDEYDEDPYSIVPAALSEALAGALAAELRLQRERTSDAWVPGPWARGTMAGEGDDLDDDEAFEVLSSRVPQMVGFAPEDLAYGVFAIDLESAIMWEGADAKAGEAAAAQEAADGAAEGGARRPSCTIVEVEEEEEGGEAAGAAGGGAAGMEVDVEVGGPGARPRRQRPAVVIRPNAPPSWAAMYGRRAPPRIGASSLLSGTVSMLHTSGSGKAAQQQQQQQDRQQQQPDAGAAEASGQGDSKNAEEGKPEEEEEDEVPVALLGASATRLAPLPQPQDPLLTHPRLFTDGSHPQMLRLQGQPPHHPKEAVAHAAAAAGGYVRSTARTYDPALALTSNDPWVETAIDGESQPSTANRPAAAAHNLNDPALVYRAQAPVDAAAAAVPEQLRRAAALVAPPVARRPVVRGPIMEAATNDVLGKQLAVFNVSQDSNYAHQAKVGPGSGRMRLCVLVMTLQTLEPHAQTYPYPYRSPYPRCRPALALRTPPSCTPPNPRTALHTPPSTLRTPHLHRTPFMPPSAPHHPPGARGPHPEVPVQARHARHHAGHAARAPHARRPAVLPPPPERVVARLRAAAHAAAAGTAAQGAGLHVQVGRDAVAEIGMHIPYTDKISCYKANRSWSSGCGLGVASGSGLALGWTAASANETMHAVV